MAAAKKVVREESASQKKSEQRKPKRRPSKERQRTPDERLLDLQQSIGNREVQRMLESGVIQRTEGLLIEELDPEVEFEPSPRPEYRQRSDEEVEALRARSEALTDQAIAEQEQERREARELYQREDISPLQVALTTMPDFTSLSWTQDHLIPLIRQGDRAAISLAVRLVFNGIPDSDDIQMIGGQGVIPQRPPWWGNFLAQQDYPPGASLLICRAILMINCFKISILLSEGIGDRNGEITLLYEELNRSSPRQEVVERLSERLAIHMFICNETYRLYTTVNAMLGNS